MSVQALDLNLVQLGTRYSLPSVSSPPHLFPCDHGTPYLCLLGFQCETEIYL